VAQRPYEIGRAAVDLLLDRFADPGSEAGHQERRIPVALKIRGSA
jgi:DNA-binding LacI/PurR family transcriptional regulator